MRFHNNNESNYLVTDKDILITEDNVTLHDVIDDHSTKIQKLESNVKWMYRYGALGSGGTGGSGSGSSTSKMVVFIYKNGTQLVSPNTKLMYPGEGFYTFKIEIHGGGSDSFLVKYNYNSGRTLSKTLSKDNEFTTEDSIELKGNNELIITILNLSTREYYMVNESPNITFPYVTSAYNITANYVYEDNHKEFINNNNLIFMDDVKDSGLMIALKYNVAVQLREEQTKIEYTDWENRDIVINSEGLYEVHDETLNLITEEINTKDWSKPGIMYLPLASNIKGLLSNPENAAFKQLTLTVKGQTIEDTDTLEFARFDFYDNLIPKGLFLNIRTNDGKLYTNYSSASSATAGNQITIGDIGFKVTPYNGSLDTTRDYQLRTYVYDIDIENNETLISSENPNPISLIDQKETDIVISISEIGVKKILFELTLNGVGTKSYIYYIHTKTFQSTFNWYPNDAENTSEMIELYYSAYYKRNIGVERISADGLLMTPGNNVQITSNDPIRTINLNYSGYNNIQPGNYDTLISLGIQYSSINDTKIPIASFNITGSTETQKLRHTIFLYQDKIAITTSDTNISSAENITMSSKNISIFLPLEDDYKPADTTKYHMFNIYKRLEKTEGQNYYRSVSSYIDGILEGLLNSYYTTDLVIDSITLYPGNYTLNLIELSLFTHTASTTKKMWLEDIDILRYYRSYNEKIVSKNEIYSNEDFQLFNIFNNFKIDDANRIEVEYDYITSIAKLAGCPTMLLRFNDTLNTVLGSAKNVNNFMNWFEQSYKETQDTTGHIPVTVQYAEPGQSLEYIKLPKDDYITTDTNATFYVDIQGSSTKEYRDKNLELYAPDAEEGYKYIYTPNINKNTDDPEYTSSFLPEGSFTLKADVVDSSHTNNNAIGKFVNDNTTQFAQAVNESNQHNSKYAKNIKNTLIGFPILLFVHTRYDLYNALNQKIGEVSKYYFLGIYNFNLGRKSYYNLGYKDISVIEPLIDANGTPDSGFALYKILSTSDQQLSSISGGEIQGNNRFFDFSQYMNAEPATDTLLFDSKSGMWGDYIGNKSEEMIKNDLANLCRKVAFAGGFVFDEIGKEMSQSSDDLYGYQGLYSKMTTYVDDEGRERIKEWVPNYHYQAYIPKDTGAEITYKFIHVEQPGVFLDLKNLIINYVDAEGVTNIPTIDYTSVSEYFTVMMAMGLVDSPMKNLNMKSWNNGKTFYAAFYDMDTGLGKSNAGTYINYFAFSDFWRSRWQRLNNSNVGELRQVDVIRDYAPEAFSDTETSSSFFDVPSSYLFAVVKYAKSIFNTIENGNEYIELNTNDPSNIWGKWRRNDGCLRNAKYFMNTYFNHHLASIPEEAFNFNYRYKYLVKNKDNDGFDSLNFMKFHGRGKAYTEYWLDGRLHILDAYFNVSGINDTINIKENREIKAPIVDISVNMQSMGDNEDVYVLQDAFSGSSTALQYPSSSSGDLIITAKQYAPMIIEYPMYKERYLFPNNGEESQIGIHFQGTVSVLFGGSKLWTSVSSISPFITLENKFSIYSKYISTLIGETRTCDDWVWKENVEPTPALRTLRLTSSGYSGNIFFMSDDLTPRYQNLDEIVISGTAINLSVANIPIRKLHAINMLQGASISATGCDKLEDVQISGVFDSLRLSSWGDDISLPTGGNLSCKSIIITNNVDRFPDASLHISNNSILESLQVTGFSHIYVSSCPNLKRIMFGDDTENSTPRLKTLDVQMPSFNNEKTFTIGRGENPTTNVVDLTKFHNLSTLRLSGTTITKVLLPNTSINPADENERRTIMLPPSAFANCKNFENFLQEGKNNLYITGEKTFYNCGTASNNGFALEMNANESVLSHVYIDKNCTSLKDTFNCTDKKGRITYSKASEFLTLRCTPDVVVNVTNIDNMFKNNSIQYLYNSNDENRFIEYLDKRCSLPLHMFVNCTSATDVFSNNNVDFFNRYMFENADNESAYHGDTLFKNVTTLQLGTMCNTFTYGTIDMLYPFINKTNIIDFKSQPNIIIFNPKVTSTGPKARNPFSVIMLNDLFCNDTENIKPEKLLSIKNFTLSPTYITGNGGTVSQTFSFKGFLDNDKENVANYKWTAAKNDGISLQNFMNAIYNVYVADANDPSFDDSYVNYLFCNTVPTYIVNSFGGFNLSNARVTESRINLTSAINIYTVFNWNNVSTKTTNLFSDTLTGSSTVGYGGFSGTKKCTYEEFLIIWKKLLLSDLLSAVSSIFTNCIITNRTWENVEFRLVDETNENNTPNESITTVPALFQNLKMIDGMNKECAIDITSRFFRPIKNLKYVPLIFENTYMKHAIPFDVFAKRKLSDVMDRCYVKTGEDTYDNRGIIARYDYDNVIVNMNSAFHNVKFSKKELATFRNGNDHNYNIIDRDYVYLPSDPDTKYYTYYKLENGSYVEYDVEQPTEIQDIDKLWSDRYEEDSTIQFNKTNSILAMINNEVELKYYRTTYSKEVRDYSLSGNRYYYNFDCFCDANEAGFVVSPDIFRCCTENCDIAASLKYDANDRTATPEPIIMNGMMPPSIFKVKYLRQMKFAGVFGGLNVSPIEIQYEDIDQIRVVNNENIPFNCERTNIYYQYILDDFTELDVLSGCFNFTLLLPYSKSTHARTVQNDANTEYEATRTSHHFFMFSDKSFTRNILRLSDTLPTDYSKKILEDGDALHMHEFYLSDNGIYFNIMRSFVSYEEMDTNNNVVHKYEFRTGIDRNVFKSFIFDSLISSDIAKIYEGYVLSRNNPWTFRETSEGATMFFQVGGTNTGWIGLSANARLQAQYKNDRMFPKNGNQYNINKTSLAIGNFDGISNLSEYWAGYNFQEYRYIVT